MLCSFHNLVLNRLQPFCARNSEGYAVEVMGLYLHSHMILGIVICFTRSRVDASQHMQSVGGHQTDSEPVPAKGTASRFFTAQW